LTVAIVPYTSTWATARETRKLTATCASSCRHAAYGQRR